MAPALPSGEPCRSCRPTCDGTIFGFTVHAETGTKTYQCDKGLQQAIQELHCDAGVECRRLPKYLCDKCSEVRQGSLSGWVWLWLNRVLW